MSLQSFDQLVNQRKQLVAWWDLRKADDFSQGKYSLRVDAVKPSMVAFCGQERPGSKNYHDAPDWFFDAVRVEIGKAGRLIVEKAVAAEIDRLTERIKAMKEQVLKQLEADEIADGVVAEAT